MHSKCPKNPNVQIPYFKVQVSNNYSVCPKFPSVQKISNVQIPSFQIQSVKNSKCQKLQVSKNAKYLNSKCPNSKEQAIPSV